MPFKALRIVSQPPDTSNWSYSTKAFDLGKIGELFLVWPWNLTDDLEKQ